MGCASSSENKDGKRANDEIENQIKNDRLKMRSEVKMYLFIHIGCY